MAITLNSPKTATDAAQFIAGKISDALARQKKVLFFATGGSSIAVGVAVSKMVQKNPHQNLTVMLTDERYGDVGHADSNFQKLIDSGFYLPDAHVIPVLIGINHAETVKRYDELAKAEYAAADYKIGLFGIGADGHVAGILPHSVAVHSSDLVCGYDSEKFSRITVTPKAIARLDEAVVFMQGEEKRKALDDLQKDLPLDVEPAQALKKVPLVTIFTNI